MALTSEQTLYQQQVFDDAEATRAQMAAVPGCPNCGRMDRMVDCDADFVLWIVANEDEASYDRYPLYRWSTGGCYLLWSPCPSCNGAQRIVPDGYKRLTMEQAIIWARRQLRLERRATQ